ncbi:hypothetical protein EG68_11704 [Paragonimus skrjabini miyazakii]|uniref:Uncharacterized protein n=1 Tax=Paragonimus skrjabini miyazakii TaxID=59628 RepID=A0A8S9YE99_9TREM|nr:hypothetical protein EG68_11704 [Paragonimus skrjabini miyazakii]
MSSLLSERTSEIPQAPAPSPTDKTFTTILCSFEKDNEKKFNEFLEKLSIGSVDLLLAVEKHLSDSVRNLRKLRPS